MKNKFKYVNLIILLLMTLSGCTKNVEPIYRSGFYLNTFVSITIYDDSKVDVLEEAMNLCEYYENIFSKTIESSNLSRLNSDGYLVVKTVEDEELFNLIDIGLGYSTDTLGALDITVEPLISLWNINSDSPNVPSSEAIDDALALVDYNNIVIDYENRKIILNNNAPLDLGAIAKGYIADRIKDFLIENNVENGIINLGGNILCIGNKPDSSKYVVGIRQPFASANDVALSLSISDLSVVTSGTYERYFTKDDNIYHHIIDPKSGYPTDNHLSSVTIISNSSVVGDCLSTACLVMGLDDAKTFINSIDDVYAIFIDDENNIYYSDGATSFVRK